MTPGTWPVTVLNQLQYSHIHGCQPLTAQLIVHLLRILLPHILNKSTQSNIQSFTHTTVRSVGMADMADKVDMLLQDLSPNQRQSQQSMLVDLSQELVNNITSFLSTTDFNALRSACKLMEDKTFSSWANYFFKIKQFSKPSLMMIHSPTLKT